MPDILTARDRLEPVEDALSGLLDLLAVHDDTVTIRSSGLFALLYPISQSVSEVNDLLRK